MTTERDARREQVLAALVTRRDAASVSGQDLADRMGCSRAAVHRHVDALRRAGVAVDGVRDGYRLADDADPVSALAATEALAAAGMGPVRWSAETASTNDDAVAAARGGAAAGLVIGADVQTAGRGRRGRTWAALPGDAVLMSVLLRPRVDVAGAGVVPIIVAVAVADALGDAVGVIWPNDLVIGGRKVCGILCELGADETGVAWIVAGIGVNVHGVPPVADARWRPGAVSTAATPRRRHDIVCDVVTRLARRMDEWRDAGPGPALAAFATRDLLDGRGVTVTVGDRDVVGTAAGIDGQGRLLVHSAAGPQALAAGEVTRVHHGLA